MDKGSQMRLFNDKRATKAILAYLGATDIGLKPNWEEEDLEEFERADNWGISLIGDEEGIG